jgi:hypothetical protein
VLEDIDLEFAHCSLTSPKSFDALSAVAIFDTVPEVLVLVAAKVVVSVAYMGREMQRCHTIAGEF